MTRIIANFVPGNVPGIAGLHVWHDDYDDDDDEPLLHPAVGYVVVHEVEFDAVIGSAVEPAVLDGNVVEGLSEQRQTYSRDGWHCDVAAPPEDDR